ncbi:hypothetical protein GF356_09300 [candidate division GN15 bacterium]|nr:hypothetical protein [candidate division GN15 bacterium]
MSSATLISLAMLKVNIDQGRDYLDYLQPFILQVLYDHRPSPVTDAVVRDHIRHDFGLEIPERTLQIVLKRLSRRHPLTRDSGVYNITGDLPNPGIATEKAAAQRHINAVASGLKEFSKDTARPITSDEEALQAICAFLAEFNIPCLRAYLRGTAIPTIEKHNDALIVLVSQYVLSLQETDPERFDSFLVVVKGHMLANALLCPDLQNAPKTYKGVTFYFDTPLLIRRLGLEGQAKQTAAKNLITLLRNLGATIAAFTHTRDELERVIYGAANWVDSPDGRGAIVMEARTVGTTKSDLLVVAGQVDDKLAAADIDVVNTPRYVRDFQIDESAFEGVLDDEVSYNNPRAKEDDINSVRSIYVLRSGSTPRNVEHSKAVLVTSNSGFAQAAFEYGKNQEETREVSSVITDFSLANMAWLKAPQGAPEIPVSEVIAFSYAALQPSKQLLDKYFDEVEKLKEKGTITERDHQLLRSSVVAQRELMNLTLGEEDALTEQTVYETLSRVTSEIKKEVSDKYKAEQASHHKTQQELATERAEKQAIQKRLYWRCLKKAKRYSWAIAIFVVLILVSGTIAGLGVTSSNMVLGWILTGTFGLVLLASFLSLVVSFTVCSMRVKLKKCLLTKMLRREKDQTGIDFG